LDNLTHSLVGLTLARTPLGKDRPGATAALVLASNAPDIDFVSIAGDTASYLEWHRGPTHGVLGVAGLGLLSAAIVWLFLRRRRRGARTPSLASFWMLGTVGVAGHVLMDVPTVYGTRLLSPWA
jgi:inner membrane protein